MFSNSLELNFRDYFRTVWTEFMDYFGQSRAEIFGNVLGSPGTDFRIIIGPCVLCCVITKMNNILVV